MTRLPAFLIAFALWIGLGAVAQAADANQPDVANNGVTTSFPVCSPICAGENNSGMTTGNSAILLQDGSYNNSLTIQRGSFNISDVSIHGVQNATTVLQTGDTNEARATVTGNQNEVTILENGSDQSLVEVNGDALSVLHDLRGYQPASVETKVTGTLSGPIEVSNPDWGKIVVQSR
jgi:hypothetical protein